MKMTSLCIVDKNSVITYKSYGAVILSRSVRHILLRLYDEAQRATTWHNVATARPARGDNEA